MVIIFAVAFIFTERRWLLLLGCVVDHLLIQQPNRDIQCFVLYFSLLLEPEITLSSLESQCIFCLWYCTFITSYVYFYACVLFVDMKYIIITDMSLIFCFSSSHL